MCNRLTTGFRPQVALRCGGLRKKCGSSLFLRLIFGSFHQGKEQEKNTLDASSIGIKKAAALWDHKPSRNNRNGASITLDTAKIQLIFKLSIGLIYFLKTTQTYVSTFCDSTASSMGGF